MFKEIPVNKLSLKMRKLVFGVGVNDSQFKIETVVDGKRFACPAYVKWKGMLQRCYSIEFQEKQPSYKGCSVCDEWLILSNFKEWMFGQDWQEKELDKDLLIQGNKVYSPDSCYFVTKQINLLLINNNASRGLLPLGASLHKRSGKYQAEYRGRGKSFYIGLYKTKKEASTAYKEFKYKLINEIAHSQLEPIKSALMRYVLPS